MNLYKNSHKNRLAAFFLSLFALQALPQVFPAISAAEIAETQTDFRLVAKKALPAVVSITTKSKSAFSNRWDDHFFDDSFFEHFFDFSSQRKDRAATVPTRLHQGSGFLISANGHIVTNSYIIPRYTDEILVRLSDGRELPATLVGHDANTDISVIKIAGENFPFLEWEDSLKAELGQWVAALGNSSGSHPFLTSGIVSSLSRGEFELRNTEDLLQTSALIHQDNAGGPLLSLSGRVLGINTILTPFKQDMIGIGFATPSHMLRFVTDQLIAKGKVIRGYLGLSLQSVTPDLASLFDIQKPEGALIAEVKPGSSAQQAGLKRGDLIVEYNHEPVKNPAMLRMAIARSEPGSQASLQVLRNKQSMQIQATIADFPQNIGPYAFFNESLKPDVLGIEVQPLTPELAQKFGLIGYEGEGMVIKDIAPNSMAAWLGLSPGSLIMEINHQPIHTADDFYRVTSALKKGENVLMLVREHSLTHYITYRVQ